ncbi:hypothetical protein ACOME3_006126 [Neoechinorhynchus agilis]
MNCFFLSLVHIAASNRLAAQDVFCTIYKRIKAGFVSLLYSFFEKNCEKFDSEEYRICPVCVVDRYDNNAFPDDMKNHMYYFHACERSPERRRLPMEVYDLAMKTAEANGIDTTMNFLRDDYDTRFDTTIDFDELAKTIHENIFQVEQSVLSDYGLDFCASRNKLICESEHNEIKDLDKVKLEDFNDLLG